MSSLPDTPLQQLGRLIEDVERRHASYDVGGANYSVCTPERRARLLNAFHGVRMGLFEAACDQRAETTADLVVQLSSAFTIIECHAESEQSADPDGDLFRVRTAIASALSVVLHSLDSAESVPLRSQAANAIGLVFERRPQAAKVPG